MYYCACNIAGECGHSTPT